MQTKPGRDKDRLLTQDAQPQGPAPSQQNKITKKTTQNKQGRACNFRISV